MQSTRNEPAAVAVLKTHGLQFVRALQGGLRLICLYSSNHPQTQKVIQRGITALNELLKTSGSVSVGFQSGSVMLNGTPVADPTLAWLAKQFVNRKIAFLVFSAGIEAVELAATIGVLANKPEVIEEKGGLIGLLREQGVRHVRVVAVPTAGDGAEGDAGAREQLAAFAAWLTLPYEQQLARLKLETGEQLFHWWLLGVENLCDQGNLAGAADSLSYLLEARGPVPEAARMEILTRAKDCLERICEGDLLEETLLKLVAAIKVRLRTESASPTEPLLEAMAMLTAYAADRRSFNVALEGAGAIRKLSEELSERAELACRVLPRLLHPDTVKSLVAESVARKHSPEVEQSIRPLLKRAGEQPARELLSLLANEADPSQQQRLLYILKLLGRSAASALLERLSDPNANVARLAITAIGEIGDPALIEQLEPALIYPDERVQDAAVSAILRCNSSTRGPLLARALHLMKPMVMEEALDDLLLLHDPQAVSHLEQFVRDVHVREHVREKALYVIGSAETKEAIDALLDCAGETTLSMHLRRSALRAISRIDVPAAEQALRFFSDTTVEPELAEESRKLLPAWSIVAE